MSAGRLLRRAGAAGLAAWMLVAGLASAQVEAYDAMEGVPYYWAAGTISSGHMVNHGDDSGALPVPFRGCGFAQLRPDTGGGRIQVIGLVDEVTYVEADFDAFVSPDGKTPAIATNLTLDGRHGQEPAVRAGSAAWGEARMEVDETPFLDPVGDGELFEARFFVARDGLRDDATLEPLPSPERGDWEMHVGLRTPGSAIPQPVSFTYAPTGDLPDGSHSPNEAYSVRQPFHNGKFGGTATARVTATANAPEGMNDFTVSFLSPTGKALQNLTMRPALLANDAQEATFPLSEFGDYAIEVRGAVALASYRVDVTLAPPQALDLDLWWEDVEFGREGSSAWNACKKQMGQATVPGVVVGRDDPPGFLLEIVIVAVVGATAAVLLAVKLVGDSVAFADFRKRSGR